MAHRLTRRATLPIGLLLLTGCQWLLGGDGSECAAAIDCPERMVCAVGRCVEDPGGEPVMDAGDAADAGVLDMTPDAEPDATAPRDMFMPRADAALPGEIEAPFAEGECFSNSASIQLGAGVTYVPHGLCARFGVLWTTDTASGRTLNIARAWPPDAAVIAVPIAPDARISTVDGRFVAVAVPGLDDAPTPAVIDLAMRVIEPQVIRDVPVSEVRRGHGLTGYLSEGRLFLTPDAEGFTTFLDCGQAGTRQWGVGLSHGQVAWFERADVGGPARVVIADSTTCSNRVVYPAQGAIAADARIESAGDRWIWIATRDGQAQVAGLAPDERGRLRPLGVATPGAPVQIAAQGDWLAVVSYVGGSWRIEALHLEDDRVRDLSAGSTNHRNPLIWNGYLSWAVLNRQGWGVQYAPLF